MAMRWVRSSLTLYHQAKLSGFGPALTLGSSIRHGTHPHRRGILPDPMGADGAPGAPPTPNRIRMSAEKACFSAGVALPAGKRGRPVSHACSPDARPRRSRGGECPI